MHASPPQYKSRPWGGRIELGDITSLLVSGAADNENDDVLRPVYRCTT